ncbi:LamG-like jellyroll fold domain-containing protein [Tuberibacillus sp. Marseille-P3662]|uniref:LamG-like jellyroll fold domain-containing protein n=1 Tax=Tuberibacillus sp. Marseille-P3662 TaxID=1965358 RepID=UPI000A1C904F|nr:LamG-like jellyroll fold domain-containing protein [Tuberibacillus sp. Marseille-P3662]
MAWHKNAAVLDGILKNYGKSLYFDGIDDYIDLGSPKELSTKYITLDVEFELDELVIGSQDPHIFNRKHSQPATVGMYFSTQSNGDLTFRVRLSGSIDNPDDLGVTLNEKTKYRAIATYDGETQKLYIDGELVDSNQASGEIDTSSLEQVTIGCRAGFVDHFWSGEINNLRVYDRGLSDEEVQNNFNGDIVSDGIVGYWKLNEGYGQISYDRSPNANNGIIKGAAWSD